MSLRSPEILEKHLLISGLCLRIVEMLWHNLGDGYSGELMAS